MERRMNRQERREHTRERLLDAALRLFAERGLGVSLDEVSAEAGLTKGAVYYNFANKDELLLAIIDRRLAQSDRSEVAELLTDASLPIGERLSAMAAQYPHNAAVPANRDFVVLMLELWTTAMRNAHFRDRFADVLRRSRAPIAVELRDRLGADPAHASRIAAMLVAMDIGFAVQHLLAPQDLPGEVYAEAYHRLLGTLVDGPAP